MLLVALNARLVVENVYRYGWLIPNPLSVFTLSTNVSVYLVYLFLFIFPGVTFCVERYVAPLSSGSRWAPFLLHLLTIAVVVMLPYFAVEQTDDFYGGSIVVLACSAVYVMKIVSYVQVCSDIQRAKRLGCLGEVMSAEELKIAEKYPECLTVRQWYEFVAFPTLSFQLWYPRNARVSKLTVLRYLAELVFCCSLITILTEQYMKPLLKNAHVHMSRHYEDRNLGPLITFTLERWLKLIVPSIYIWLLSFIALFHCYLNLLAELTMFGDRRFYDTWWNAVSFREYWQKWNLPVHKWMVRHVYGPCRASGLPPIVNALMVFILSGLVHEYIIVIPLHLRMNGVISMAFIVQIPLIMLTDTGFVKARPVLGNCLFWFTNCFTGQPVAILLFFLLRQGQASRTGQL